ncbi:TIGR02680 family protein [Actinopolyspora mortivallis]|uniref:TIGR02680 family protein n=1 Tax=Actinopolyspora mortivallis TaxID=33906 RepID=UPI000379BB54|nr:TIGR02680 family protein [Actinopolyspora mortivallis]
MSTEAVTHPDGAEDRGHRLAPGSDGTGGGHGDRWRLRRGGVINIWQYADQEFDLRGGRAVFQGTNGSGKSRTLELLLPLCLDGDLRHIGSKGFDTVSMRRLMLDEREGGGNRTGYAWVELSRRLDDGGERFLTCGVGVKATVSANQVSDSWRFVTERRVGHDLRLVNPDGFPLGPTQLREELGADGIFDERSFREHIADVVYGITPERYGDLLHLQRTLRNPDVGLRVQEGQLEQILSDALPPLDPALVQRLATSFEDLESIRENILRLSTADTALSTFMASYSDYAFTVLRSRAEAVREARKQRDALHSEIAELERRHTSEQDGRTSAEERVSELERQERELESSLEALRASPAYTQLRNLHDRRALVENARSAAEGALRTAGSHRDQEQRSVSTVLGMLSRLGSDVEAAGRHCERAAERMSASGLDRSLVPAVPTVPQAEATVHSEYVRATTDPESESEWLTVERHTPPQPDTEEFASRLHEVEERAERAAEAARERAALVTALHQQAVDSERQRAEVEEIRKQAERARDTATSAAARRNQLRQDLRDTASDWVERARSWWNETPLAGESGSEQLPALPTVDDLVADRLAARRTRERLREAVQPVLRRARERVTDAERELEQARCAVGTREGELAELRSGGEPHPSRPCWASAERDPAEGSPFYRTVDFADSLPEDERAALEGALQASGLLNAWVSADGTAVDPDTAELLAHPGEPAGGSTLAGLLVPAVEPGSPVSAERVLRLLNTVAVSPRRGVLAVDTEGRWSCGPLSGAWVKETAEYVGAGARQAARERRIAELEDELTGLRAELAEAQRRRAETLRHAEALDEALESYPDDGELFSAHARFSTAVDDADDAQRTANKLRGEHELADRRWQAVHAELARVAGQAGLRPDSDSLAAAHRAANEAHEALSSLRETIGQRCLGTLEQVRTTMLHHDATVADRMAAESLAEQHCEHHAEQTAVLAELSASVGEEGRRVSEQVADLEEQRERLRAEIPEVRERASAAREEVGKLSEKLNSARQRLTERDSEERTAVEALRDAMLLPAFWSAAAGAVEGELPTSPPDVEEAVGTLLSVPESPPSRGLKEVHDRLHPLKQSLSGHYDITTEERARALTVTVLGEEGPLPVAEAARQTAERLSEQREYLNERYRAIFADYLIRDLAERLRDQISTARDLCDRMNRVLEGARSSQGVHVQLDWQPAASLSEDMRQAVEVIRTPFARRTEEQDTLLRRVFTDLIESQRESVSGGYAEILAEALDYRGWYEFTVRVRDTGPDGSQRVRRLRQLSSGETRLVSYVTLFAAAASFYDAIESSAVRHEPLRLVLLDEAFERLDDPTVARMLGLLVDLDMDWLITWPSGWGVSPKIPKMHIYDVLRPRSGHGIACTHTVWNGRGLERAEQ